MTTQSRNAVSNTSNHLRDLAGLAFFAFAALVSGAAAWQQPSLLGWLYAFHNLLLALFYAKRKPAERYDRLGLWLGMIAAFLPALPTNQTAPWYLLLPGLAGYALCLWALLTLGPRFGIAPADRGITAKGPYRFLRHPMYLGELVFRLAMVFTAQDIFLGLLLAFLLAEIQVWRIHREESLIAGYGCYQKIVRWRLLPGVW
jgi:protein-S-isoprenylcysteine O-methyltransferase Ste14